MTSAQKMTPDFSKLNGLVPAIIQDSSTKLVLMVGFMNEEALQITIDSKKVTFFSRTREELWTKGETSGNYLLVEDMQLDCDQDTLLIQARPTGPTCHTGKDTCFGEVKNVSTDLGFLQAIIQNRKNNPKEGSYTNLLFDKGMNKIAQKVGEEAVELVIEAKDSNDELFLNEAADLMYHYLVLLSAKNFELSDVIEVLKERHK